MKAADFDYDLPDECIAQLPAEPRDAARLLVCTGDARSAAEGDQRVRDLPSLLRPGDLCVFNDTRVLPARLFGQRLSGGRVEFLFIEPDAQAAGVWRAMVQPAKKLRVGERIQVAGGAAQLVMVEREVDRDGRPGAVWSVEPGAGDGDLAGDIWSLLERHGEMPLPPYITRQASETDRARYQTVYADQLGAVAAPTAGLHFTPELLTQLEARGIATAMVTLHVGMGTFLPMKVEDVEQHVMHSERFVLGEEAVQAIEACRTRGGRVIAIGTTSLRVLEAGAAPDGTLRATAGATDLFIRPGYEFRVVDGLLTNFHLPRSTLLMLVSALMGRERMLELYRQAVRSGYRFYSYGDAMLLVPG